MNGTDATAPKRKLLAARSEYFEDFGTLLARARRELRIFDADLSGLDMNGLGRIESLARLLRGSRTHRIFIALHDVEHVTRHCPRLIALLGSHADGLLIHGTQGDAAKAQDCFVLADDDHLLRRPVRSHPRGVLVLDDPKECQPMRERFDEIWESSLPGVSANTTGL